MAKRQIRISQNDIRSLIKEAIGRSLDDNGHMRFPEGVFSTDSEEGEEMKAYAKKYDRPGKEDDLMWDPVKRQYKPAAENMTGEKWADNPMSSWDSPEKRDKVAMDKYGDEKAESDMFDRPFGDLDDTENLWQGDDELEEPDEEINERRQIRLSEGQLREFVSYSVAKLLKEAMGRDIYLSNGEYDGYEEDEYGTDSFVFEPDIDKYLDDDIDFPEYPKVKVHYTKSEGMKGDGYMQPDDPDAYSLDSWEIVNQAGMPQEAIRATKEYMENDFNLEDEAANHEMMNESRLGEWSPAGFEDDVLDSQKRMMKKSEEPGREGMKVGGFGLNKGVPSKYKDENGDWLSWEEYCKMKEAERGGDDDLPNVLRGGKGGSVGGFKK